MAEPDSTREQARRYLEDSSRATLRAADACLDDIVAAADLIAASLHRGGKVLICGNGGSAADAQHLAAELVSCLTRDHRRQALAAIALTTDSSIITAISNDFGYEGVFERQVEALGRPGDVLLAISTSGSSPNVLRALARAKAQGMRTVALTGADGGKIKPVSDVSACVPEASTGHIQEAHLAVEHLLATLVERRLFPRER